MPDPLSMSQTAIFDGCTMGSAKTTDAFIAGFRHIIQPAIMGGMMALPKPKPPTPYCDDRCASHKGYSCNCVMALFEQGQVGFVGVGDLAALELRVLANMFQGEVLVFDSAAQSRELSRSGIEDLASMVIAIDREDRVAPMHYEILKSRDHPVSIKETMRGNRSKRRKHRRR